MRLIPLISLTLYSTWTIAAWAPSPSDCLTDAETDDITTRWLDLWGTGAVTSMSNLTSILDPNITSYDEAFGPPTIGIQEFFDAVTAPGNFSTTGVVQSRLFSFHTCDQIALRWLYTGYSTGYDSTVPAGTFVTFKGTDLLRIDLITRLIYNATSTGDWINLSRQLGECNLE